MNRTYKPAETATRSPWLLSLCAAALICIALAGVTHPEIVVAQEPPTIVPGGPFSSPVDTPTPLPTVTWTPMPTPTYTPTYTPTATPTVTPTPAYPAFQVSPLLIQPGNVRGPGNDALVWMGAAALLVLAGSVILLLGTQQNAK